MSPSPVSTPRANLWVRRLTECLLLLAASIPASMVLLNIAAGADSLDTVKVFATDEASGAVRLMRMLGARSLDPAPFFRYGSAYPIASYGLVRLLEWFGYPLTYQLILLAMRTISALCVAATVVVVFGTARNLGVSRPLALAAAIVPASVGDILLFGMMVHPDTMQMLFCTASLWFLSRGTSVRHLLLASVSVGLAAGTKYGGASFLATIATVLLLRAWEPNQLRPRWRAMGRAALVIVSCALVAALVFAAVNWHAWWHWEQFIDDVQFEARHVSRGHGGEAKAAPWMWAGAIAHGVGWLPATVIFGGSLIAAHLSAVRTWTSRFRDRRALFVLATSATLLVLVVNLVLAVRFRQVRYLFPIIPMGVIVAAWACQRLLDRVPPRWMEPTLVVVGAFTLLSAVTGARYRPLIEQRLGQYGSETYRFGQFLAERLPVDTDFVADRRVYLPPVRRRFEVQHWLDRELVRTQKPDVVVLAARSTGRLVWPKADTRVEQKKWAVSRKDHARQATNDLRWLVDKAGYVAAYQDEQWIAFTRSELADRLRSRMD